VDLDSLATWARVIAERATIFRRVMSMAMENLSIAQHQDTLWYAHTRGGNYKLKVRQIDVVILCFFSGNLMILWTFLPVTLSWRLRRSSLQVCWSYKELTNAQFGIIPKTVHPATCWTWILPSSCWLGPLHLTICVKVCQRTYDVD